MKKEFELQFANGRTYVWVGLCLGGAFLFNLSLYSLSRAGIVPVAAFNAMESNWTLLYRGLLPAVVILESLAWFFRPFRDGTLQWWFFAGMNRSIQWRDRWLVLVLRGFLFWIVLVVSTVAALLVLWGFTPYPLGDSYLSAASQLARFAMATGNALCVSLFWISATLLATVALWRHRFETGAVLALCFVASLVVSGRVTSGPLAALGGGYGRLFVVPTPGMGYWYGLWLGDLSILAIAALLYFAAGLVYRHVGFSPRENQE